MKDLAIARALDDDTRKSGIWMRNANGEVEVYSLHITDHWIFGMPTHKSLTR